MGTDKPPLKIGTRGSALALYQANAVQAMLRERDPELVTELVIIKTQGEMLPSRELVNFSGQGIFTRELDLALTDGRIDLAVHSLKDLPTVMHDGTALAAVTKREAAQEAFLSNHHASFQALPEGAKMATGSPRRKSQILAQRPDIQVVPLRGNVETRIRKLDEGEADAIILACAGLIRLEFAHRITERLPLETFVPAPGQGAIGVTVREGDEETAQQAALAQDPDTACAVTAERAFLLRLGGGCKTPIACHALFREDRLVVMGFLSSADGRTVLQDTLIGPGENATVLGDTLAEKFLSQGAEKILEETDHDR